MRTKLELGGGYELTLVNDPAGIYLIAERNGMCMEVYLDGEQSLLLSKLLKFYEKTRSTKGDK